VSQYPDYHRFEETVIKDVEFGPRNLGMSEEECRARAERALRLVGLDPEEKGGYSPFDLSGGEKRRVAIAGVLAMEPEVLILDEPTAGLDPQGHRDILGMIEAVRKDRSLTIIIVSHNMDDVARLADHVLVMHRGRLVMDGGPREVFAREEELRGMGLGLPSGAEFLSMLRERGVSVDTGVLTIEETEEKIAELFGR
jgi:energy-coupling factor transport system ATP-binding protein